MARRKKKDVDPPTELPDAYGRTRVVLMDVDPLRLYAYWEVTPRDRARAGAATRWVLRFHDLTRPDAPSAFDIPIDLACPGWYVELWADDKTYVADLGPVKRGGRFVAVCRSNVLTTPRSTPSARYDPRWMSVERDAAWTVPPPEPLAPLDPPPPPPELRAPRRRAGRSRAGDPEARRHGGRLRLPHPVPIAVPVPVPVPVSAPAPVPLGLSSGQSGLAGNG